MTASPQHYIHHPSQHSKSQPPSSPWGTIVVSCLRHHQLAALADGTAGAIRIPSFLPESLADAILGRLSPEHLERYDPKNYPVDAYRFGPTLNEYCDGGNLRAAYWDAASAANRTWTARFADLGVRDHIRTQLGSASHTTVGPACVHGRPMYWPIVREISSGTLLHWDDISREYSDGLFDEPIISQFAVNIFITAPRIGGELRIWRRTWHPDDERKRHAFGYCSSLVTETPDLVIQAKRGDAVIFHPAHYHDVAPSSDDRRVTISLFLGIVGDGLVTWS